MAVKRDARDISRSLPRFCATRVNLRARVVVVDGGDDSVAVRRAVCMLLFIFPRVGTRARLTKSSAARLGSGAMKHADAASIKHFASNKAKHCPTQKPRRPYLLVKFGSRRRSPGGERKSHYPDLIRSPLNYCFIAPPPPTIRVPAFPSFSSRTLRTGRICLFSARAGQSSFCLRVAG